MTNETKAHWTSPVLKQAQVTAETEASILEAFGLS